MFIARRRFRRATTNKKCEAKSCNEQPGSDAQPGEESFRKDPFRRVKRYNTERVYRNCMRRSDNSAQQYCMTGLSLRSDEISGDKSLAMPRFERMKSTQHSCYKSSRSHEEKVSAVRTD